MKSRTTIIIIALIVLSILTASCALAKKDKDRQGTFEYSGTVDSINRTSGDFTLRDGRNTYHIDTDRAAFQLNTGQRASLRDIDDGTSVRVVGTWTSDDVLRADTVVIINKSKPGNYRDDNYRSSRQDTITGTVTKVNARANQIHVRSGSRNYVVAADYRTDILRNSRSIKIDDIRENDEVTVTGYMRGTDRLDAASINITSRWNNDRWDNNRRSDDRWSSDRYRTRSSMIEGAIVSTTSIFDRTVAIRTYSGDVKLDVSKDASVYRDGRSASIHDYKKGDRVRAYGKWDHETMSVTRIEAYSGGYKGRDYPRYDDARKYDSRRDSRYDVVRVGRIKSIDSRRHEMTIDTGSDTLRVNADHADLQYRDKKVEFNQLEVGDRVDARGNLNRDVLNADSIEVY